MPRKHLIAPVCNATRHRIAVYPSIRLMDMDLLIDRFTAPVDPPA
jgi:hypothetical protein